MTLHFKIDVSFRHKSHRSTSSTSGLIYLHDYTMNGFRTIVFCLFLFVRSTTFGDQRFLSLTQFNDATCTSVASVLTFIFNEESATSCFHAGLNTFAMVALTPTFRDDVNNITQLRISYYQDAQCHSPAMISDQLQRPTQYFNFPGSDGALVTDGMKSDTPGRSMSSRSCVCDSTVSSVYWNVQLRSTSTASPTKGDSSDYGLLIQVGQLDITTNLLTRHITST